MPNDVKQFKAMEAEMRLLKQQRDAFKEDLDVYRKYAEQQRGTIDNLRGRIHVLEEQDAGQLMYAVTEVLAKLKKVENAVEYYIRVRGGNQHLPREDYADRIADEMVEARNFADALRGPAHEAPADPPEPAIDPLVLRGRPNAQVWIDDVMYIDPPEEIQAAAPQADVNAPQRELLNVPPEEWENVVDNIVDNHRLVPAPPRPEWFIPPAAPRNPQAQVVQAMERVDQFREFARRMQNLPRAR